MASSTIKRAILRSIQKGEDGAAERAVLGLQVRAYNQDHWEEDLDELLAIGLVVEGSVVRWSSSGKQRRAAIVYRLNVNDGEYPNFADMTSEQVEEFVAQWRATGIATA